VVGGGGGGGGLLLAGHTGSVRGRGVSLEGHEKKVNGSRFRCDSTSTEAKKYRPLVGGLLKYVREEMGGNPKKKCNSEDVYAEGKRGGKKRDPAEGRSGS